MDAGPAARAHRLQPRSGPRGAEDRLAGGHEPDVARAAQAFVPPGSWVAWQASGELAVDPSNASSFSDCSTRGTRAWSEEACAAFGVDPRGCAPVRRADAALGPIARLAARGDGPAGVDAGRARRGRRDGGDARRGRGRAGRGLRRDGHRRAGVRGGRRAGASTRRALVELHPHADPETWLLENPGWLSGGAYRWFRDELCGPETARAAETGAEVYELMNELAEGAPPGCRAASSLGAGAGRRDGARVERAGARRLVRRRPPRTRRAHLVRALLEGNAMAFRDVIEAIGDAGHAPRRGRVRRRRRARAAAVRAARARHRACRSPAPTTSRRRRAARRCSPRPARAAPVGRRRGAGDGRASATSRCEPDPELRDRLRRPASPATARLYAALRPLFDGDGVAVT